jgi:hypothetical protein
VHNRQTAVIVASVEPTAYAAAGNGPAR